MEIIPKKYQGKKFVKKKTRKHIWMKIGWGRAERSGGRSPIIIIITGIISAFFPARTEAPPCLFFFVFLFFGKSAGVAPPHVPLVRPRGAAEHGAYNYAMSTSGRTFKLALIKYWLRVVFFINRWAFLRDPRPIQYQCESAVLLKCSDVG